MALTTRPAEQVRPGDHVWFGAFLFRVTDVLLAADVSVTESGGRLFQIPRTQLVHVNRTPGWSPA